MTRRPIDEKLMTDFLLGNLPEEEIERLDELSLSDDEFVSQLQLVDNDLVDAYVRGELSGTTLTQFKSNYLKSPKRQEKVAFAEALQKQINKPAIAVHRSDFQWGFAAAAIIIFLLGGYLIYENLGLQNEVRQMQAEQQSFRQREQQLRKQIADLKNQPKSSKTNEVKLLAFVLMPQTRGTNKIPLLNIPSGIDFIALTLKLEINEFAMYQATLKNAATDTMIWKSENLKADKKNSIQIQVPANLLQPQNFLIELSGISTDGNAEVISSYPFKVATQ
jgi:hypothetical protein